MQIKRGLFIKSPAKINIHLEIGRKRDDGFHEILSIFQMVSLFDDIFISSLKENNICTVNGNFDFPEEDNLIYKAVSLFRKETGITPGLAVTVEKRIPVGAGLGGGSSNAASVLIGLNLLFKTGLAGDKLAEIGAEIGSDVPFFCLAATAIVSGRGEKLEDTFMYSGYSAVILFPGISMSTIEAYKLFDKSGKYSSCKKGDMINDYCSKSPEKWTFFNSFLEVLDKFSPVFKLCIKRFYTFGAVFASVSGSGSAVFGVFNTHIEARTAFEALKASGESVWLVKPLENRPEAIIR